MSIKKKKTVALFAIVAALAIGVTVALVVKTHNSTKETGMFTGESALEHGEESIVWMESIPDLSEDYFASHPENFGSEVAEPIQQN